MSTATLYLVNGLTSVCVRGRTYRVTHGDGPGPVPAATAVLERNGWRVAGDWVQDAGGVTGGIWKATVEEVADADLAARYWDERQGPYLRSSGVPEDALSAMRIRYIANACASPGALRELRKIYAGDNERAN